MKVYDYDVIWFIDTVKSLLKSWYNEYELSTFSIKINPIHMIDKDLYNDECHDDIICEYNDICLLSKYAKNTIDNKTCFYYSGDSEKLYTFDVRYLMKDCIMLLDCIVHNTSLRKILITGRDHSLYKSILSYMNPDLIIDSCNTNEFGRKINDEYDCIFIIPFMKSVLWPFFNIKSKYYIIYGLYEYSPNIEYYDDSFDKIEDVKSHKYEIQDVNSTYWYGYIFGDGKFNLDPYDKAKGSCIDGVDDNGE